MVIATAAAAAGFSGSVLSRVLFRRGPGEEESVGLDVFPIRDRLARHTAAVTRKKVFEFLAAEPAFPFRSFESSPGVGAFVDDDDFSAGPDDAAQLGDGSRNVDGV